MKRYFYNIIAVAAALFSLSACTEAIEEIFTPTSEDAATVKFQLGVDAVNGVQFGSRAIYDYESEVNDVTVFLIDVNTKKVTQLQWEAGEIATETVSNHIVLDLAAKDEDVNGNEVKAGTYDVYALANFNSSLGTVFLDDIDTEAKVKSLLAMNLERSIECKGSDRLPMAAMSDPSKPFKVKSDSQLGQGEYNILDAHLKRLNAHIEFNFSSGTGVTFTPQYYRIYNLPKQAKPFAAEADRTPDETFDYPENISLIKSSFEFWVLENSQASNSAVTAYTDRDRWNGYISNTQKKNFTNAPEKSTYVVVTGNYEDANYTGTVSYTIHLGNMMNNQWGNFSALRNEYHTYNVKVNGVNSILVECKVTGNTGTENQPGVDGNIISKTNVANTYIIDAHYETLMAEIAATTVTATPLTMTVRMASPKTGFGVGEAAVYTIDNNGTITDTKTNQTVTLDQTDLKWFQFVKPTATESSAPYATGCATCSGSGKIYTTTYVVCTACSGTGIIKANSTTH
ncbi:MAG: DUF4906 domain-containing protein, partial [Bacteroidaceae bacterium]|nr:DUF4906 domain-containing protein [Bacteroidaceae bacterium]